MRPSRQNRVRSKHTDLSRKQQRTLQDNSVASPQVGDVLETETTATYEFKCKSEDEIRDYLKDKSLVIFATSSYIETEVVEENNREVITSLSPIITKRLDYTYHKVMEVEVEEQQFEIQDKLWQFLEPSKQELTLTKVYVESEDVATREYWDAQKAEYVSTKDSMLSVNMRLSGTMRKQEETAYDFLALISDIGGFVDFIFLLGAPIVAMIMSDRIQYIIMRSMYLMNRRHHDEYNQMDASGFDDIENEGQTPRQKERVKESQWLHETGKYEESWWEQVKLNSCVQCLMCRWAVECPCCSKCYK